MIIEFIEAAMSTARYELLPKESESYYGEIPTCKGVWATGKTLEACRLELQDTLDGWIALRLRRGLKIPVVRGKSLRPLTRVSVGGKT